MHSDDVALGRLVDLVGRSSPGLGGATRLVCIDGPAGSGKTTLAGRLGALLPAQVVHMDDLYEGWTGLEAGVARLHEWVLTPLARGLPGRYRRFDWDLGAYRERHNVPLADHLIVEGCGSGALGVDRYGPVVLWVEAPDELRLDRGLTRDGAAAEPQWRAFMEMETAHYAANRTRERARVRLDGFGRIVAG